MADYDTYLDRLMAGRGLENHELAANVGTSRQAIYKLRKGLTRMLPHWAKRLAPHLGVTWQELVDGEPTPPDQDRTDLLIAFDAMDSEQRQILLGMAKMMGRREQAPVEPTRPRSKRRSAACVAPLPTIRQRLP